MRRGTATFILSFSLLAGCASKEIAIKFYSIGTIERCAVGGTIMSWGSFIETGLSHRITGGVMKELLYNGIDHEVLQISYREYFGGPGPLTTSAFNQDLKYDVSKARTITFREIRIRIDSADQEKMTYSILAGPADEPAALSSSEVSGMGLDDSLKVLSVSAGSDASAAGIKVGDRILSVGGRMLSGGSGDQLESLLTGDPETSIEVVIRRGEREMNVYMRRHN